MDLIGIVGVAGVILGGYLPITVITYFTLGCVTDWGWGRRTIKKALCWLAWANGPDDPTHY